MSFPNQLPYYFVDPKEFAEVSASGRVVKDKNVNGIFIATIRELRSTISSHGRRKLRLLNFFQTLPLDVIECIFGFLHPLDLLHLARTTKSLRSLLFSRSSNSIWETSFLNHPSVPHYPKGCSPPRWTDLLYGHNTTCSFCDNSTSISDLVHLHRICSHCASDVGGKYYMLGTISGYRVNAHLCTVAERLDLKSLLDEHPEDAQIVPSLLTPSFPLRQSGKASRATERGISWMGECEEICSTYLKTIERAWRKEEGAREKLEKYLDSRTAVVGRVREQIPSYSTWARQLYETIERQGAYLHPESWATRKFLALGYQRSDLLHPHMTAWLTRFKLERDRYVTRTRWTRIYNIVEPTLQVIKNERLLQESTRLYNGRIMVITRIYQLTYLPSLSQAQLPLTPMRLPLVQSRRLLELVFGETALEIDKDRLQIEFPDIFREWQQLRIAEVALEVRKCYPEELRATSGRDSSRPPQELDDRGVLNLAISAFTCTSCPSISKDQDPLLGWEELAYHLGCYDLDPYDLCPSKKMLDEATPALSFFKSYSKVAYDFVRQLGLDPLKTTARELDEIDARFVCGYCPITEKTSGRKALTWRGCIYHQAHETSDGDHPPNGMFWLQLSPPAVAAVKRREIPDFSVPKWLCLVCPGDISTASGYEALKRHLKSNHNIAKPLIRRHLLNRCSPLRKYLPARLYESSRSLADCKCRHCPLEQTRLFRKKSLAMHLRDKHQLLEMKEEDSQVVDLFVK
ncbi:hypothetical protein BDN72DRAFT_959223 [Pluteus cervinus]|uniref:Uncharacterized protein n=1 Tax=Pluteus cervinus TaxID=181527 RepID=A0ACD3AVQ7_9AGAR|nr:hypothetical protein BDN72DRAFT_959223 [Pluteus cervinus]